MRSYDSLKVSWGRGWWFENVRHAHLPQYFGLGFTKTREFLHWCGWPWSRAVTCESWVLCVGISWSPVVPLGFRCPPFAVWQGFGWRRSWSFGNISSIDLLLTYERWSPLSYVLHGWGQVWLDPYLKGRLWVHWKDTMRRGRGPVWWREHLWRWTSGIYT